MTGVEIRYKLHIPEGMSHSNYNYQKFFRQLYGYTQIVSKSSGKRYEYNRKGIVSTTPFIKNGKNSLIVPKKHLKKFLGFFESKNNSFSKAKMTWKVSYSTTEITLNDQQNSIIKKSGENWN